MDTLMHKNPQSTGCETQLQLASILQEYRAICQELEGTVDSQHRRTLLAWGAACLDAFSTVVEAQRSQQFDTLQVARYHQR
jgi:hypothetical protein